MRIHSAFLIFLLSVALSACSTPTNLTLTWKDDNYAKLPLNDILIVGVSQDPLQRKRFEDAFAQALQQQGSRAVASYAVSPSEQKLDRASVEEALAGNDLRLVLVTHLLGVDQSETYHPPQTFILPKRYFVGGYYRHYISAWERVQVPGYYSQHVAVRLETNIYDAQAESVVWSTRSETLDPTSADAAIESVINEIIENLKQQKLLE